MGTSSLFGKVLLDLPLTNPPASFKLLLMITRAMMMSRKHAQFSAR